MSRSSHARRFVGTCGAGPGSSVFAHADAQEPGPAAASDMKPYVQTIAGTEVKFEMVPIPGGEFLMGSPPGRPSGPRTRARSTR